MTKPEYPLDRSAAHAALLELSPDGFGECDLDAASETITRFLESWRASDSKDMFAHAREWLEADPIISGDATTSQGRPAQSVPAVTGVAGQSQAEPDVGR